MAVLTTFHHVGFRLKKELWLGSQIVREYPCAYMAVCPETGETYSLILPYVNESRMNLFMQGVSETFAD